MDAQIDDLFWRDFIHREAYGKALLVRERHELLKVPPLKRYKKPRISAEKNRAYKKAQRERWLRLGIVLPKSDAEREWLAQQVSK